MKKKIMIISMFLFMLMMFISFNEVQAAPATPSLDAYEVVNCWDGTKEWTDNGAKITLPGGVPDAWNRRADILANDTYGPLFKIDDGQTISFSFSIKLFDSDGSIISKSNNSSALDIFVMNKSNDSEIMLLRIWTDAGGYNNGNHSYEIYPEFGNWGNVIYGSNWIAGDATEDSEFTIQFSKASLFESYVGGSANLTRLDNGNNDLLGFTSRFDDVDQVYFRIAGDNGFTANTEITVKSVNGQSLANTSGIFDDVVAPIIDIGNVNQTIIEDEAYTIPVSAYDLLGNPITYSILDSTDVVLSTDNIYTPVDSGNDVTVTLVATDAAGNSSEVDLTFDITNTIDLPELQNVPTLSNQAVDLFSMIVFDAPTVVDETGTYTLKLNIYDPTDLVNPIYVLDTLNAQDEFELIIPGDFLTGDYVFNYEAENVAGITQSANQTITISNNSLYIPTIVSQSDGLSDYVAEGIRCRTIDDSLFIIGEFDMEYGFDIKFAVRDSSTNILNNGSNGYIELVLSDPENPANYITFRVWLDIVNVDNPTNIFIQYEDQEEIDIPNAGWIDNSVDSENMQFHMYFDLDSYFSADRLSGKAAADVGQTEIQAFLDTLSSSTLSVGMRAYSNTDTDFFEFLITEINGQSMDTTNGVFNSQSDAFIDLKSHIDEIVLLDSPIDFDVYVNDLYGDITYTAEITQPDDTIVTLTDLNNGFSFTPTTVGDYSVVLKTTGASGNEVVTEEITFLCKNKITVPTFELDSNYSATYALNETITVINGVYSNDVLESTKSITIINPLQEETVVSMGDSYTFDIPGIYFITYYGEDETLPTPNVINEVITINVPDDINPVITVNGIPENIVMNNEFTITDIMIDEDSTYELVVTLINPDGEEEVVTLTNDQLVLSPNKAGSWQVKFQVTDLYDNVTEEIYAFNVKTISTGGLIAAISGAVVVITGIIAGVVILKRR